MLEASRRRRDPVLTSSGCVAQAWREGGARQALLTRLLRGLSEHELGQGVSRNVGELCARSGTADVIDAHLALLVRDHDTVLTSDVTDIRRLLTARSCTALVRHC